tara:strand:+ start:544 stop:813 length:270 start_codon:yes stop_codon:yes gene_type:complete
MKDKEIFEKFMEWMGMKISEQKEVDEKIVIRYVDSFSEDDRFTKCGYDEFYTGAIFDKNGNIVKAYIDSHVAYSSENSDCINEILHNEK